MKIEEEDEFMKHLLADIALDPTGGASPESKQRSGSGSGSGSPGKRKRAEEGDDEYGDEGWDWEGLLGPAIDTGADQVVGRMGLQMEDSLDVTEAVLGGHSASTSRVKRELSSIKVEYEEPRPILAPPQVSEVSKPALADPAALAVWQQEDLDEFDFDFPLSQESFLDDPVPRLPPTRYPIIHPLVHPPRPPTFKTNPDTAFPSTSPWQPTPWARCTITSILPASPEDEETRWGWGEKVLLLACVKTGRKYKIRLREEAGEMLVMVGDIANIISPLVDTSVIARSPVKKSSLFRGSGKLHPSLPVNPTISSSEPQMLKEEEDHIPELEPIEIIISHKYPDNYFIHHPDFLLPMTTIVGALGCRRKPIIQSLLKSGAQ